MGQSEIGELVTGTGVIGQNWAANFVGLIKFCQVEKLPKPFNPPTAF